VALNWNLVTRGTPGRCNVASEGPPKDYSPEVQHRHDSAGCSGSSPMKSLTALRSRCLHPMFQGNPVTRDDGFVEGKARFRAVPLDEFANGVVERPLRTWRRKTVQNRRFGPLKIRKAQDRFGAALVFVFDHARILSEAGRTSPLRGHQPVVHCGVMVSVTSFISPEAMRSYSSINNSTLALWSAAVLLISVNLIADILSSSRG
jgi:hypothetical protein